MSVWGLAARASATNFKASFRFIFAWWTAAIGLTTYLITSPCFSENHDSGCGAAHRANPVLLRSARHPRDRVRSTLHPARSPAASHHRTEEHTTELQSLMRTSYAVFC